MTADDNRPIDWQNEFQSIRPTGVHDSTWAVLSAAPSGLVGDQWGDYVRSLDETVSGATTPNSGDLSVQAALSALLAGFNPALAVQEKASRMHGVGL